MKDLHTIKLKVVALLQEHVYFKPNGHDAKIELDYLSEIEQCLWYYSWSHLVPDEFCKMTYRFMN